jgi:cGMP-dependent protein kinase
MPDAKRGEMLRNVPVMRSLTEAQRDKLGGLMQHRQFASGAMIFRKGDSPDGFYIIIQGSVRIIGENNGNQVTLASLRAGDYFGETALLNADVRSASVLADADADCLFLQRDDFAAVFTAVDLSFAKRGGVTSEGASGQGAFHVPERTPESSYKSQSVFAQLLGAFNHNPLLRQMSTEQKQALVEGTHRITARADEVVIAQGEAGAHLFVIETGTLSVSKGGRAMGTMGSGTVFGELAILYNVPRAATVTATTECVLWVIDRFSFRKIARNIAESTIQQVVAFLAEVPLLRALSASEREKIAEAVEEKFVTAGETVVYEGEEGHCMYLLVRGHCQAVKRTASTAGGVVREYTQAGDFFGELALKGETEGKRQASVVAVTNTYLLTLGREAFKLLLGPLDQVIDKAAEKYSDAGPVEEPPRAGSAVSWSELESLGTLGKGSFGHVQLVRERSTGTLYALKSVLKQQIVDTQQQGHILSEKRVMERLQHPFLNTLHTTFRSRNKLHLILEPCLGGELFGVLRRRKLFPEHHARFYAASVVLAFAYMHSKDTVYRDLKPENLMLTDQGYVKVADFGFAKCLDRTGKTWTLCGTPDYLAPEIVASRGHGKAVDWWTLGILIFEMVASYPPFYDNDQIATYNKILAGKLAFPSHFSLEVRELLAGLLERRATRRLGVGVTGVERLM